MNHLIKRLGIVLALLVAEFCFAFTFPGGRVPLCTSDDPDFDAYYYREHIPRCKRNVSESTKIAIAEEYGIPASQYKNYHYDHIISLCAGGSNDPANLQPRLPEKKLLKDKVEWDVCRKMTRGEMSQKEAIHTLRSLAVDNANE